MDRLKLTFIMFLWGSIGLFTRQIELSPTVLAFTRAVIALPVLFLFLRAGKTSFRIPFVQIRPYILSGALIGLCWSALFYGFKNTSISTATIVYNMCPVYVMLAAPILLREKLTRLQAATIAISFIGLFLVVGNVTLVGNALSGLLLSGVSGILYAAIVINNRKVKVKIDYTLATFVQLSSAVVILLPFVLFEGELGKIVELNPKGLLFLGILGIVHTGIAYRMYFSVYYRMEAIHIVSYSYLEPVFAIILSMVFIGEVLTLSQVLGGLMILASTYIGEYLKSRRPVTASYSFKKKNHQVRN